MSEARNYPHLAAALGEIRSPAHAPRPPADRPVGDAPAPRTAEGLTCSNCGRPHDSDRPHGPWLTMDLDRASVIVRRLMTDPGLALYGPDIVTEVNAAHARVSALTATVERMERECDAHADAWRLCVERRSRTESQRDALTALAEDAEHRLDRIVRPIWWIQEDAKRSGYGFNGGAAVALSNDAGWLRSEAEKVRDDLRARLATITGEAGSTSKDAKDG